MTFINELQSLLGRYALVKDADKAPFLTDERGRYRGDAIAVALPATHEEVMKVMALAARYQIPVVTQGGNTSTVGGSVPLPDSNALLLSLKRMRSILSIDPVSDTIHAQAGVTLTEVHEAVESINRLFPLRLASEGTATVGGLLASNAGGTEVLRYGMTRDLVLGYRAVLADVREINELMSLRKNNSGYDLRDLLIGSEGTLAVITEAILKLHPRPLDRKVLFLSLKDLKSVEVVFNAFNAKMHAQMTAFELMGRPTLNKLALMMPEVRQPEVEKTDWHVFIECSYFEANPDTSTLESVLESLMENGAVVDGAISETEDDAKDFWRVRESIPPAHKKAGGNVKHDIALPRHRLVEFIESVCAALKEKYDWLEPSVFGHYGDGNLHFNMGVEAPFDPKIVFTVEKDIHAFVYEKVIAMGGTISAEHGIGQLKRDAMTMAKDPVALEMMQAIKKAFDPDNRLNPGKLLPKI